MIPPVDQTLSGTARYWLLGGILLGFFLLKLTFNPYPVGDFGRDGSYYYQVARHVSEGDELLTSVSLYHQGLKKLPHPSTIYPLWPLILGGVGAVIGLDKAASLLPKIFYFIDLILLYILTNIIAQTWGKTAVIVFRQGRILDVGHLVVMLMGINHNFFLITSLPFTEALAFCLTVTALLLLIRSSKEPRILWGVGAGALAALAYLTRSQMFGLVTFIPVSLLLIGLKEQKYRQIAVAAALTGMVLILVWVFYLLKVVGHFTPRMLLDFEAYHETPELPPYSSRIPIQSFSGFIKDLIYGSLVAFNPNNPFSYVRSFGMSVYLIPLAALYLLAHPEALRRTLQHITSRTSFSVVGTLSGAVGCLIGVHAFHQASPPPWLFHFRHGLPIILVIAVAMGYLLAQDSQILRFFVLFLIMWSLVTSAGELKKKMRISYEGPTKAQQELAAWIAEQKVPPVFVTTRPWALGALTRGLFHGVKCNQPATQTILYFQYVNVNYLITHSFDDNCRFFTGVKQNLKPIREFGNGSDKIIVWRYQSD